MALRAKAASMTSNLTRLVMLFFAALAMTIAVGLAV
jgi:hypothetical protein